MINQTEVDLEGDIIKQSISLLDEVGFNGAKNELEQAIVNYKKGKHGDCILKVHMAFESTMKSVLKKLNINPKNNKTATLIFTIHQHKIIHPALDNFSHTLRTLFEKGLPNLRNREGISHGQGLDVLTINESYSNFALNMACNFISLLVKRYKEIAPSIKMKKIHKLINETHVRLRQKGNSGTMQSYMHHINNFLLNLNKDPEKTTEDDIIEYLRKAKYNYGGHTLWLMSTALCFFTNSILKKHFEYSKIRKIANIGKYPIKSLTKPLSLEDFQLLLKAEINGKHKFWIKFIWNTGVTTRQFVNMKIRDVDFKNKEVIIRRGNEEIDSVSISPELALECEQFVNNSQNRDKFYNLFQGRKGGINYRTLQHAFREAAREAGLKRSLTVQAVRLGNPNLRRIQEIKTKRNYQSRKYSRLRSIRKPFGLLSESELNKLCSGFINQKHRFWFKIIYYLGTYQLKKDELYSFETKNVNLRERKILVNSKLMELSEPLYKLFKAYFEHYPNNRYIFQNITGGFISDHGMRQAINRARRINNITSLINYENLHKSILEFQP